MFNNHQLFIQMRIRNSRMINGFQTFCEHHFGQGDVAEGDRTFLEETFSHLTVDELVDERADAFLGIFVERAGGCFHRVAIIRIACSRVNGFGPGYWKSSLFTFSSGWALQ